MYRGIEVPGLHTLWPIGEESFRVLVAARPARVPPSDTKDIWGQKSLVESRLDADQAVTHAVQIDAPSSDVWVWLSQMMRGGGMYGWPRLESLDCRSAEFLIDGIPPPREGDRVGEVFDLSGVSPNEGMIWRSRPGLTLLGFPVFELTVEYRLESLSSEQSCLSARTCIARRHSTALIRKHLLELLDCILSAHQLVHLKRLAETHGLSARASGPPATRHQAAGFFPAEVILHGHRLG